MIDACGSIASSCPTLLNRNHGKQLNGSLYFRWYQYLLIAMVAMSLTCLHSSAVFAQEEGGDEFAEFADEPAPPAEAADAGGAAPAQDAPAADGGNAGGSAESSCCSVGFISHSESVISSSFWHSPLAWFHYS